MKHLLDTIIFMPQGTLVFSLITQDSSLSLYCHIYVPKENDYKKILNALITMPSGTGRDTPPIDILELATNDLTASNLQRYINKLR